jgi:hypothetical protein
MGTEPAPVAKSAVSEHPVADLERRDATADRLDLSANSLPSTVTFGLISPVKSLVKRACPPGSRSRSDSPSWREPDQHLVVLGRRLLDV